MGATSVTKKKRTRKKKKATPLGDTQELAAEWSQLPVEIRHDERITVPADQELDLRFLRRRPVPCPRCRRIRLDDGLSQACIIRTTFGTVAYMLCRGCENTFKVPIVDGL